MARVVIDVADGRQAFDLCYCLTDLAQGYKHKQMYVKDGEEWFLDYLKRQETFFSGLARQVARQTKMP